MLISLLICNVLIFQSGAWPFSANAGVPEEQADKSTLDFNVPSDLAVCIDKFKTFYNKKVSYFQIFKVHITSSLTPPLVQ